MAKSGPKGPRAKVRHVLLIKGYPDSLYEDRIDTSYTLTWSGKTFSLGKCGEDLPKALKEMNTYAQINIVKKPQKRLKLCGVNYGDGISVNIKKVGENTHVIVNAVDDCGLSEGVARISKELKGSGLDLIERCHWTCDYDPGNGQGKKQPTPTPTPAPLPKSIPTPRPSPYPVSYDLATGKVNCGVYKKTMLFPRDCDVCLMKKQCGTYAEIKEKTTGGK